MESYDYRNIWVDDVDRLVAIKSRLYEAHGPKIPADELRDMAKTIDAILDRLEM